VCALCKSMVLRRAPQGAMSKRAYHWLASVVQESASDLRTIALCQTVCTLQR